MNRLTAKRHENFRQRTSLAVTLVGLGLLLVLAGCGGTTTVNADFAVPAVPHPATGGVPWNRPDNTLALTVKAGLVPERYEHLTYHVHAHLDVWVNGKRVTVPAGIGINIRDKGVNTFTNSDGSKAYGGISMCNKPCISPLHTHDTTGVLHTESATPRPNTLGEFFTEWGVRLTRACAGGYCRPDSIRWYVDGKRYTGNPASIQLSNHKEIALVIGSPPKSIPSSYDFSNI